MSDDRKYRVGDLVRLSAIGVRHAIISLRAFEFAGISYPIMLVNPDKIYKRASKWVWIITATPESYVTHPGSWFAYVVEPYHLKSRDGLFRSAITSQLAVGSPDLPRHPVRICFNFYSNGVNEDHIVKFLGKFRSIKSRRRLTVKRNNEGEDA